MTDRYQRRGRDRDVYWSCHESHSSSLWNTRMCRPPSQLHTTHNHHSSNTQTHCTTTATVVVKYSQVAHNCNTTAFQNNQTNVNLTRVQKIAQNKLRLLATASRKICPILFKVTIIVNLHPRQYPTHTQHFSRWHVYSVIDFIITNESITHLVLSLTLKEFWQEAPLLQRDHAMHYVSNSKFTLRFTSYGRNKGFTQQKWPSRSFKGIDNGAIQWATYDFVLVFHCNYVSILHH